MAIIDHRRDDLRRAKIKPRSPLGKTKTEVHRVPSADLSAQGAKRLSIVLVESQPDEPVVATLAHVIGDIVAQSTIPGEVKNAWFTVIAVVEPAWN